MIVALIYPWKTENQGFFDIFRGYKKGALTGNGLNIGPKWVKHWRDGYNLMLLAWNTSSSIVKQNDCKNKTTWLTQTALSKSFSLFHNTYIEDIKGFFKDYFFVQKLFYIKRFRNKMVFKFSKNVELKVVKWPENRITCEIKDRG